MNIANYIIVGLMGVVGVGSCLLIVWLLITTLAKKIYRKVKYGISLFN